MLAKFKEIQQLNNLVGQKVKAKREEIMGEKIRKATGREVYTEIYKPITEEMESQKEQLSSQLKALPGIKEQLESLDDEIKDIQRYQGLPQLFQEPQPITWSPEKDEKPKRQQEWGDESVRWIPTEKLKELDDYGREKMGITETSPGMVKLEKDERESPQKDRRRKILGNHKLTKSGTLGNHRFTRDEIPGSCKLITNNKN